jgi:hypothetical protein
MTSQTVVSVNCPNCRTPFTAPMQSIVDAQKDPTAKSLVLTGNLNAIACPQCGFQGLLNAPFLYHDARLEIAFVYAPLDSGMTNVGQQKIIGDLTNRLMQALPAEERKGYLFQPQTFITPDGLVNAILERDDESRELVEGQRRKVELLGQLRDIDPLDSLAVASFVGANDEELDESFFQLLDIVIDIAESQGNAAERERLSRHREHLMSKSATGRLYQAQEQAVQALSASPTRETLIEQLVASDEPLVREALVATGRQLLDYAFFQALTARIQAAEQDGNAEAQARLVALRKEVLEIRDKIDAVLAEVWNRRASFLQSLMMADNPQELMLRRASELDPAFFNVLGANLRQAEEEGRTDVIQRLHEIGDMVIELMNRMAPPEIKLTNRLMTAEDDEQVRQVLEEERGQLSAELLEFVGRAISDMQQDPVQNKERIERLSYAAGQIKALIG